MNYGDAGKQFCSEVASAACQPFGVTLWMGLSPLSSRGVTSWLSAVTALRAQRVKSVHAALKARLLENVEKFKGERGYAPPYWELLRMARAARRDGAIKN